MDAAASPLSPDHNDLEATTASGIIRLLDRAVADAGTSAVAAASEVEEARRNARAASEVARRFMSHGGLPIKEFGALPLAFSNGSTADGRSSSYLPISSSTTPRRPLPVSPRSPFSVNGGRASSPLSATPLSGASADHRMKRKNGSSPVFWHGSSNPHSPSSSKHSEEIVSLTIELDRAKQALEAEQLRHDETKSALTQTQTKAAQLESQMERLLNDLETQRDAAGRQVDALEHELAHARMRVEAAEEDANLALEIAKDNDQRREEAEAELLAAHAELEELKAQVATLSRAPPRTNPPPRPPPPPSPPHPSPTAKNGASQSDVVVHKPTSPSPKVVRFAEKSQPATSPLGDSSPQEPRPFVTARPDRLLVASGRALLQNRSLDSSASAPLPAASANLNLDEIEERRKRLRERVKTFEEQLSPTASTSTAASFASPSPLKDPDYPLSLSGAGGPLESATRDAAIRNAARMLQASGRRLGLSGRWWSGDVAAASRVGTASSPAGKGSPVSTASSASAASSAALPPLETLTRHYCTSVELNHGIGYGRAQVLVEKKQREIIELESLCALWEQGSLSDGRA